MAIARSLGCWGNFTGALGICQNARILGEKGVIRGKGKSSGCPSWRGHRERVVVGKHFRNGPYRDSRNNLRGRRHQSWGRKHMMDRRGSFALLTLKSAASSCPPAPSFPRGVCSHGAHGNPVEQHMWSGAQSGGRRAQKAGCRSWGARFGARDTESRVQSVGRKVWGAGHRKRGAERGVQGLGRGAQKAGCRSWGVGH